MSEIKEKTSSFEIGTKKPDQEYYYDSYGNKYVNHAVSGMQPSGHRYSEGGIIYYFDSSNKMVDGSSIPAMCVDNCLKNGKRTETKRGNEVRYVYLHDGIEVVTRSDNVIITVTKIK